MGEINDRIQAIVDTLFGGNKRLFSNKIGISPTSLEGILGKRQSAPSFGILQKILSIENINSDWLIRGEGEMCRKSTHININGGYNNHTNNSFTVNEKGGKNTIYNERHKEIESIYEKQIADYKNLITMYQDQIHNLQDQNNRLISLLETQSKPIEYGVTAIHEPNTRTKEVPKKKRKIPKG